MPVFDTTVSGICFPLLSLTVLIQMVEREKNQPNRAVKQRKTGTSYNPLKYPATMDFIIWAVSSLFRWMRLKIYQYEVTFSLYMLTPIEKLIFSTLRLSLVQNTLGTPC